MRMYVTMVDRDSYVISMSHTFKLVGDGPNNGKDSSDVFDPDLFLFILLKIQLNLDMITFLPCYSMKRI